MKNKKTKELIIFIAIIIMVSATILPKEINDLDELWNYNFAKHITDGKIPYKDFNMITTPLLPIICSVFLKILGNELIVMRFLAIILNSLILFMIYKIMKLLKINIYLNFFVMIIFYFVFFNLFCIDYNFTILLVSLIGLYIELKSISNEDNIIKGNFKQDLLLGILIGATIALKQTVGFIISFAFIFYKIFAVTKKSEIKELLKIIITRIIGVLIPVIILAIYFLINNIWKDFVYYCILGIKTFSNKISYLSLLKSNIIYIRFLSVLIPISFIYFLIAIFFKIKRNKEDKNKFVIFCYSVPMFAMAFPISDTIHFLIGSTIAVISIVYLLNTKINNLKFRVYAKEYIKALTILFIIFISIVAISILIGYLLNYKSYSKLNHFKYIPCYFDESINDVDLFILEKNKQGKNVYILDAAACIYMIPLDKCNKDYDLFLKGNIGADGELGQIEKLKKEKDCYLLILNDDYVRNWQTPETVREFIKTKYNKVDEKLHFDIYYLGEE